MSHYNEKAAAAIRYSFNAVAVTASCKYNSTIVRKMQEVSGKKVGQNF